VDIKDSLDAQFSRILLYIDIKWSDAFVDCISRVSSTIYSIPVKFTSERDFEVRKTIAGTKKKGCN
jgi:hypothetical protein